MNKRRSVALALLMIIAVSSMLSAPYSSLAAATSANYLAINLTDNFNKPLVNAAVALMREGVFEATATADTDAFGNASFSIADGAGRFYVTATLKTKDVPNELFFNNADYVRYTYISHIIRFNPSTPVALILDWNNYVLVHTTENRHFQSFYLRTDDIPHYLLRIDDGIKISHNYLFLPMNRVYKIWRATDSNRANEFLLWWDFYALPGETINAY